MKPPLPHPPERWIDSTLGGMTLEQKLSQILHPFIRPEWTDAELDQWLGGLPVGGAFIFAGTTAETAACAQRIQARVGVPALISSDLENGAGRMLRDATVFPDLMAVAATGSEEYAHGMGRAAALEGRAAGIHWSFAPVVDINANPRNPITNTRSLGDDPALISRLACAMIRGMQDNGLCATAKHFPGDGYDDRDQHVCTTVNPLSADDWGRQSGLMFRAAIETGVWSVMIGHIAFPDWDPGDGRSVLSAPPATVSRRIVTDLLRTKLGFEGLVITDALGMGGFTSWDRRETILPAAVAAGCDMLLFCEPVGDFRILQQAVAEGVLSQERIDEAVRSILSLKFRLGLQNHCGPAPAPAGATAEFQDLSDRIAADAVTVVVDHYDAIPMRLGPGSKVLNYHLRGDPSFHVDEVDQMLRDRGCEVIRASESPDEPMPDNQTMDNCDAILVHMVYGPSWMTNRIRPSGNYVRDLVLRIPLHDRRVVFVSYGTPYLQYDLPRIPALINAYSPDHATRAAVLRVICGETKARGVSPVRLPLAVG